MKIPDALRQVLFTMDTAPSAEPPDMPDRDDELEQEMDPTHCLPWDEILAAQANEKLQRAGHREFEPRSRSEAQRCPQCGRPAEALAWIYFTNSAECWASECGREGWIVACMDCRRQTDFLLTIMS